MPNKSLGRIKVFCNFEIWIFLVWIIPQQSSVSPPSKALVYRPTSLLWSLIGQMVTFTNAWPWVRSRLESYLTTPKAFAILAETSTVPGNMSFNWKAQLVGQKNWSWMPLCDGWEHSAASEKLSGEAFEGGKECVALQYQATTKLAFSQLSISSKEKKDGGAMHLGGGGENASSLVRGFCLQDSQRSHGSCAFWTLIIFTPLKKK